MYGRAILFGVLAGFAVMTLIYGAFTMEATSTGRVSATMIDYSVFSYTVGAIVLFMAALAMRHRGRENRFFR